SPPHRGRMAIGRAAGPDRPRRTAGLEPHRKRAPRRPHPVFDFEGWLRASPGHFRLVRRIWTSPARALRKAPRHGCGAYALPDDRFSLRGGFGLSVGALPGYSLPAITPRKAAPYRSSLASPTPGRARISASVSGSCTAIARNVVSWNTT